VTRRVVVPAAVGAVALLAAAYFGYLTLRGRHADPGATQPVSVHTRTVTGKGFSIGAPASMRVTRKHGTVTLSDKRHSLVVTVGRATAGPLRHTARGFVRSLRDGYRRVRVLGHQSQRVDGRPALATYGHAVNAHGARIRFVTVTVRARPRDYAITAFTAYGSDPTRVLPKVNAIASTFRVGG
jgi:hypothetical protein